MGKRKLHGQTYYQCDWTGFPMRNTNCYMPTWPSGKLVRRGSYCNWESVVAHARHMYDVDKCLEDDEMNRIMEHVTEIVGCVPDYKQHHFTFLEHFKDDKDYWEHVSPGPRNWSMDEYHKQCCKSMQDVTGVKISSSGEVFDVLMSATPKGKLDFASYISRPYMMQGPEHTIAQFESAKKTMKDRAVSIFYWPGKNGLPQNSIASKIFKMQIFGDVLIVQQTKESTFMPRERYVNFTKQQFEDVFCANKKKKTSDVRALTAAEFQSVKEEMQTSLNDFEASVSSSAERPRDLARAASMPPPQGKELAEVAREVFGHQTPEKKRKFEALENRMTAPQRVSSSALVEVQA